MAGADVATLPPKILWQLYQHPLTDKGLDGFMKDWAKTGQKLI
jgi:transaldolase